jgi:hypothetical protein
MSVHVAQYRTMRRRCGARRRPGNETACTRNAVAIADPASKITLTALPGFHIY